MSDQEQFKRHTAFKLRVGEILLGKPILEEEKFKLSRTSNVAERKLIKENLDTLQQYLVKYKVGSFSSVNVKILCLL